MRKLLAASVIVLALFGMIGFCAPGCAGHSQPVTATGKAAFAADQVVLRLAELQNAAIDANTRGTLADGPAIQIVRFTVGGARIAKASPGGWRASIVTAWAAVKSHLPALTGSLAALIATLDSFLGGR